MAIPERFSELIGNIIKTCGLLEWHINHFIKSFSKDTILVKQLPLGRRIEVLRDLMLDQPKLKAAEVKSLCDELKKIAEHRNVIAHNPVTTGAEGSYVLDVLLKPDRPFTKKFTDADLEILHKHAMATLGKLIGLVHKTGLFDRLKTKSQFDCARASRIFCAANETEYYDLRWPNRVRPGWRPGRRRGRHGKWAEPLLERVSRRRRVGLWVKFSGQVVPDEAEIFPAEQPPTNDGAVTAIKMLTAVAVN